MGGKRNLEDALNNILDNINPIVEDVVKEAGVKARKDYKDKAHQVVKHYYDSYTPRSYRYKRKYRLYKTFNSFNKTSGTTIHVGVDFDGFKLMGQYDNDKKNRRNGSGSKYHQSGGAWKPIGWPSQKPKKIGYNPDGSDIYEQFGAVEWSFIFSNFWEGEHPITVGSKETGYVYKPKKDKQSPEDLFAEYVNTYPEEVLLPFIENRVRHKIFKELMK